MPKRTATERVAANIRAELARQGISQTDLAASLHKSQPTVSRRLLGRVPFSVDELDIIADLLDVPMAQLVAA
jgi:transcriptional regulator with XRE-family HTH domain